MIEREFKKLKKGSHVAIIQTGWEAVVLNTQSNGFVLISFNIPNVV